MSDAFENRPLDRPRRLSASRAIASALALALGLTVAALAGCAQRPSAAAGAAAATADDAFATPESAPAPLSCPAEMPAGTRCLAGTDSAGAHYVVAVPADWNGTLVLHAHGGPALGVPRLERSVEDLQRWAVVVRAGYAWAGSSFRQGGVAVRSAAEDTERLRRIFVAQVAAPKLTILHGQSWGASVAAVGASMFTRQEAGRAPYDAVLLTSGVLAGGTRAYDFRLDLRAIYQVLCANHPRPDEPAYPLWMGLPPDSPLKPADLGRRVDDCLGLSQPAAVRMPEQQRRVDTIVRTVRIPESSIQGHLNWATWHFQDVVQRRTGGRNPFGNVGAIYGDATGRDAELNAAVPRYPADPAAVTAFGRDTDPDGRIPVPVLTVHGVEDPIAFVEMDAAFKETMTRAGAADRLVQTFTRDDTHSYLSDAAYVTLLAALSDWARGGAKPTPAGIAAGCTRHESRFGRGCRFLPEFTPAPLETRVAPRERP